MQQVRRLAPRPRRLPSEGAMAHAGFVLTGVVTTLLGPILPALSAQWSLNDTQAGYLFTAQFVGSMAGMAASIRLGARLGPWRLLAVGYGAIAAGIAGLVPAPWPLGILPVFGYGVGLGFTIPTTNLLVSEASPGRRAAALNILNFAWSLGAVLSPPVIAFLAGRGRTALLLAGLAGLSGTLAVYFLRAGGDLRPSLPETSPGQPPLPAGRGMLAALVGALIFLYVGTETAVAGWVTTYGRRLSAVPASLPALAQSTFWGALLLGRLAAPLALRRVRTERVVLFGLAVAAAGLAILLLTTQPTGLVASMALAGLGLAAIFPTTIAILSESFGAAAPRVAAPVFALGGLGGATLPWVVGLLSTHSGSLRTGLFVPLLSALAMIALQSAIILVLKQAAGARGPGLKAEARGAPR